MKIINRKDPLERVLDVYAIYWVNNTRKHYVIPYEDYFGFMVVSQENTELTDNSIDDFLLIKASDGTDMLVHWAAAKDALLDRMIDPPNPEAHAELMRRIKEGRPER